MSTLHPTAIIGQDVVIGPGCSIGPHVIIEDGVRLGANNRIMAGAMLCSGTSLGTGNEIHMRAVIGHVPQDTSFSGKPSKTLIGDNNTIREFVTIHRGTAPGSATVLGSGNLIMAYCHIAHNCHLGNHITLVNQASLTGHCVLEDRVFLSGMTGLHQFTRVGRLAMLSALSAVNKDIPPYILCGGRPAVALGVNIVGLRRAGIGPEARGEIKQAFKLLYRSGLNVGQAVEAIQKNLRSPEVAHLLKFISESERGILDGSQEADNDTLMPRKNNRLSGSAPV